MADNSLRMELLARDFNRMLEDLSAIDASVVFRDVVRGVAERVMTSATRSTKAADAGKILSRFANKKFTTFGGKVYYLENRYADGLWSNLETMRRDSLDAKINAIGLAKQSWQHVAASFGANIAASAPGYVAAANSRGRRYPQDGSSSEAGSGSGFALTVKNTSPIAPAAGGGGALSRAMRGEVKYFERNLLNHSFATVASRAKKYPGIFVNPSLAA